MSCRRGRRDKLVSLTIILCHIVLVLRVMLRYLVICVFHLAKDLLESMTKSVWTQPFTRGAAEHTQDARLCAAWTLPCNWSHYFHHPCRVNQGETSIPIFFLFSRCHRVTVVAFLILPLSNPHFRLPPPLIFQSSGEVKNWLNICLPVGNEPANATSSACSISTAAARHTEAHLLPSKSQTERKMSCECESISCLFQIFISPSLRLFLHLPFSLSFVERDWFPFYLHTWPLYSATIVLSSSLLISQSVILRFFFIIVYLFILSRRQHCLLWKSKAKSCSPPPAAGREDKVQGKECH